MEIHPHNQSKSRTDATQKGDVFDPTRPVRESIQRRATESPAASGSDRIEVSGRARALAEEGEGATGSERAERLQALKAQVESGELNTPERARESAGRMLGA